MRVLICGDRHWGDVESIRQQMLTLPSGSIVIHGAARGADGIARDLALSMGLEQWPFPANWQAFGRAAGPIRNRQMLLEGRPEEVWAFHRCLDDSRGTANMVGQAREAGVPVRVFGGG